MTDYAHAITHAAPFDGLRSLIADWRAELARRAAYRETRRQLLSLSDRELDDLGVARWDIDRVARCAAYGR